MMRQPSQPLQNMLAENEDTPQMGRKELSKDRFDKELSFSPPVSKTIRWQSVSLHSDMHMQHQNEQHKLWPEGDVGVGASPLH